MTETQIARSFDVVWRSHFTDAYLCCPEANHPTRQPPPRPVIVAMPIGADLTHDEVRHRVTQAMPGTVKQLAARAGCEERRVYAVISHWSRKGQLMTEGPYKHTVYSVRTEGQ